MSELLLAGDVGGTKVRVRLIDASDDRVVAEQVLRNRPVMAALAEVREKSGPLMAACLGCAGRVVNGRVFTTNRPGEEISESSVAEALGLAVSRVRLVNDLVAHVAGLDACETVAIRSGKPVGDVEALIMPGTGLGTGLRARTIDGWLPLASEAAQGDLGLASPALDELLPRLRMEVGLQTRLTWEQICSGPGLARLHAVLHGTRSEPETIVQSFTDGDANSRRSVELLMRFLGTFAGNVCLTTSATRGITVGGSLFDALCAVDADYVNQALTAAFNACGPQVLREMMASIPLRRLTSTDSGLIGAAMLAEELV